MQALKRGDKGDQVRAVQRILKKVGLFDGNIGGNFGPLTEEAVIGFQHLHNGPGGKRLSATGTTTEATWWALQNPQEAWATPPDLKPGTSGEDVKVLQRLLKSRGVFSGSVRGNYRNLTESAVKAFQESHVGQDGKPLAVTGVTNAGTWWALLHPAAAKAGNEVGRPTLRYGDKGADVIALQKLLKKRAGFKGSTKGNFLKLTEESVRYFQSTHVGPDGHFLDPDGIVGTSTWWALRNHSGPPQASGLDWDIPDGIGSLRRKQLEIVIRERQAKVKEIPDDTNWGGGVEKYRGNRQPWCCYFWSWGTKQATGRYPFGAKLGHCLTAWRKAQSQGVAHNKGDYIPIPGDAFVILRRDSKNKLTGRGHIGFVLRVEVAGGKAVAIDTVEGNTGNRVKVGRRLLSQKDLVGFINQYPPDAQPTGWQTGLGKTDIGGSKSTL